MRCEECEGTGECTAEGCLDGVDVRDDDNCGECQGSGMCPDCNGDGFV